MVYGTTDKNKAIEFATRKNAKHGTCKTHFVVVTYPDGHPVSSSYGVLEKFFTGILTDINGEKHGPYWLNVGGFKAI